MSTHRLQLFVLTALIAGVGTVSARGAEPLPRDEKNITGRFDNGVSYVIRTNATPPGRVMAYLHVKTGALNEADEQNGLAHFIEHMAFNGSEHFPPGKLVPLLSSLGMTFGADTNAHTNLRETVYKLNLPDNKPERIELAMKIFRDYASGLSFAPQEIDSERKVILEEARSKKSAGERIHKQVMKQVYAGTRLAVHDVIGDEEQIKTFPREQFLDYWNARYQPEEMTLVVVGDVKPDEILPAAKKWLGEFRSRAPVRERLKAGLKPTTTDKAFIFTDPEQVSGEIEFVAMSPGRAAPTTYEEYRTEVVEQIATRMVNRRFRELV